MPQRFCIGERLRILAEQREHSLSNHEICRRYGIQMTQLLRWRRSAERMRDLPLRRNSLRMGRTPEFSDYEGMLLDYVFTRRRARLIVNVRNIVETLIQMIPEELRKPYDCMRQWVYRFLDRNRLTIRRITRNVSLDDVELQRRATVFLDEVREICIGNPNVISSTWIKLQFTTTNSIERQSIRWEQETLLY